jgi:hypothetical protein
VKVIVETTAYAKALVKLDRKVQTQTLAAAAQNLRTMAKLIRCPPSGPHRNGKAGVRAITMNYCRSFSTESTQLGHRLAA